MTYEISQFTSKKRGIVRNNAIILLTILIKLISNQLLLADDSLQKGLIEGINMDSKNYLVSYTLNYPAYIRLRIGIMDGPLYGTLLDWEYRTMGAHKESWSRIKDNIKLPINQESLTYAVNYFTNDDMDKKFMQLNEIMVHPAQLAMGKALPAYNVNQIHKGHNRKYCREPKINICPSGQNEKTPEDILIIKEPTLFRINIESSDKQWLTKEFYTIHIFLDNIFIGGELIGYVPYNYWFNPERLNKGLHLITVNINSFNDHIGTAHLPIQVEK